MKITITRPELVRAAAFFESREARFYYCGGTFFEPAPERGVFVVAMDGVRMSVGYDPEGAIEGDSATVKLSKDILKALKLGSGVLTITTDFARLDGDKPVIGPIAPVGGSFPTWRRYVPRVKSKTCAGAFQPKYLADFIKAAKVLCRDDPVSMRLFGDDPNEPYIVKLAKRDDWFGVLMPVRAELAPDLPDWLPTA